MLLFVGKKNKKNQNNISSFASSTLAKAAFLCTVLLEETEYHHLSFRIGLFGLEMPRPPASNRALEVGHMYTDTENHHLSFRIGLFGLEMPRPPASNRTLEVGHMYRYPGIGVSSPVLQDWTVWP